MALFKVDIEKSRGTEFWTNRYVVDQANLADAFLLGEDIVAAERQFHPSEVTFTKYRASDLNPSTDQFITGPISLPGLLTPGNSILPLFNVIRVDFAAGFGRPSRKFYRGILYESNTESGTILGALLASISASLLPLVEGGNLVDVDGTPLSSVTPFSTIAMRQLRRGSRRRTTPIIP